MDHRRSDRRYDRKLTIDFVHDGTTHSVETRNISLGGIFVATELRLTYGTKVGLKMRLTANSDIIEVDAHVRWIENEGERQVGLGLRFDSLRARDIWVLSKYLEESAALEES